MYVRMYAHIHAGVAGDGHLILAAPLKPKQRFRFCMYVSMYVCMYVCMYVRMHTYTGVRRDSLRAPDTCCSAQAKAALDSFCVYVCMYVCMYVFTHKHT